MTVRAALLGLGLTLLPGAANADTYGGADIYRDCARYESTAEAAVARAYCSGYVLGVAAAANGRGIICLPAGTTGQQIVDIVWGYLATYQDPHTLPAFLAVPAALVSVYPCTRS